QELIGDKSLEHFRMEYEKLHRALKKSHESEKRLIKKCRELNAEIVSNANKVQMALNLSKEDQSTIQNLKREIERAWKMVEASHEKEQRAKETIHNLKLEINNLSHLVEQGAGLSVNQENTVNNLITQRDELLRTRDSLEAKVAKMTQENIQMTEIMQRHESENLQGEVEMANTRDVFNAKRTEAERELRRRERLEKELDDLKKSQEAREAILKKCKADSKVQEETKEQQEKLLDDYRFKAVQLKQDNEKAEMALSGMKLSNKDEEAKRQVLLEENEEIKAQIKQTSEATKLVTMEKDKAQKALEQLKRKKDIEDDERREVEAQRSVLKADTENLIREIDVLRKQDSLVFGLKLALAAFQRSMSWPRQLRISATIVTVTCEVAVYCPDCVSAYELVAAAAYLCDIRGRCPLAVWIVERVLCRPRADIAAALHLGRPPASAAAGIGAAVALARRWAGCYSPIIKRNRVPFRSGFETGYPKGEPPQQTVLGAFTLAKQQKLERLLEATPQKTFRGRVIPALSCWKVKHSGRNNVGRITTRHRGGGTRQRLRFVDFKRGRKELAPCPCGGAAGAHPALAGASSAATVAPAAAAAALPAGRLPSHRCYQHGLHTMEAFRAGYARVRQKTEKVGDKVMRQALNSQAEIKDKLHEVRDFMHMAGPKRQYSIAGRDLQEECQLSEGGFAFVWKVRDLRTDEELVVKKIACQDAEKEAMVRREVQILERLPKHPNVVKYYGHVVRSGDRGTEAILLFELCPGGHLLDLLERAKGVLSEECILSVFSDLVTAVAFLHDQTPPVQHRDLKVENVLLGADGRFKLCDFGSWSDERSDPSSLDRKGMSDLQETIERYTTMMYRPPEMVDFYLKFTISEKVDVWMLGCIAFTLMFYRHPFQDDGSLAIANARYAMPPQPRHSPKLQDLCHWLLARDPADRPSARRRPGPPLSEGRASARRAVCACGFCGEVGHVPLQEEDSTIITQ
ncbi:unnamed protein product, partial [Prorocentrum cordatum]